MKHSTHVTRSSWSVSGSSLGALAAFALSGSVLAQVPCENAAETLQRAAVPHRVSTAMEILKSNCRPLLPEIRTALESQRWSDKVVLVPEHRLQLLNLAVAQGYEEAAAISVQVLETGTWPDGESITPAVGAEIVRGLRPALDQYRTLLLLDVYEQVQVPEVRLAVVQTLRDGVAPMALLPVLDAYWSGSGEVQVAAAEIIAAQPEKKAGEVLTRVAKELPEGPVLAWARRLAEAHNIKAASEAARRG